ncbi:hypothetical protein [Hymenobacter sp. APR13]|uniref:hypothetical protein n=1 Tax=Hymenobacter sp. APR13 TaxID=1356852 RepID=UPI0004E04EF0|nr:hypothetical protein [Hymenobacter sp. APR13]AII53850.1 hypothetical protein N008_17935 [Hymenobacter sp. APR13]
MEHTASLVEPLVRIRHLMGYIHEVDQVTVPAVMAEMTGLLLHQTELRIGAARYRLADIEFYLHSRAHPDTFIHGEPEQRQCGRWYYNRAGGVDLTFGNGTDAGGILLRGLLRLDEPGGVVYGPQRVLRELVAVQAPVWESAGGWRLEAAEQQPNTVWQTERVNLKQVDSPYRNLPYRFIAHSDYLRQLPTSVRSKLWRELGLTADDLSTAHHA